MKKPKVSVVMPVYNGERYLVESINSVLLQSFKDFELIVVNDGSTDNTAELLKKVRDKRLKVINNYKNLGLVPSLNKGLKVAKGEYIARADADDLNDKDRFKEQVNFLDKNDKYILVGTNAELINDKGKVVGKINHPEEDTQIRRLVIKWSNVILHPSIMFRRSALKEIGVYRNLFNKGAEDYDLWFRMLSVGKVYNLQKKLVQRRVHQDAYTKEFHLRVEFFAIVARIVNLPRYLVNLFNG